MRTRKPLLYGLLIAAFSVLIVAVALVGYNLLSLAFDTTPTPTATRELVVVVVTATATPASTPATVTATPSAASATPTASTTPEPPTIPQVTVVADLLNVRAGPGVEYALIATVPQGTVLRAEGRTEDGQWLLVCCVNEQWGWVLNQPDLVSLNFDLGALPAVVVPTPVPTAIPTRPPLPPTLTPIPTAPNWPTPTTAPWPTATPPPPPTPTPIVVDGWLGQYYGNSDLVGTPLLIRVDPAIRFNWGAGSPAPGIIPPDYFSVRWTRSQWFDAGTVRFVARVDDGVRVWVDGILIIDDWKSGSVRTASGERYLDAGWHNLRVEYFERTGEALIDFSWERPITFPEWRGDYFSNLNLAGQPTLVRNDLQIAFNWGYGSPAPGIPADNFSVRWTRQLYFEQGVYRFAVQVDDGARVWIDGILVINAWQDNPGSLFAVERNLSTGWHSLQVDYFEHTGQALIFFNWALVGSTPTPIPPTATPIPLTATPTAIPTRTPTPTLVPSRTPSPTAPPQSTIVPLPTDTPTRRATSTPTPSPTNPPTASPTPTQTEPPQSTIVPLPTDTPTREPTETPTSTPTATPTYTPTDEPTSTPTEESTWTPVPTDTPTTEATSTPTRQPTATATLAATDTPTSEPTATDTPVIGPIEPPNPAPTRPFPQATRTPPQPAPTATKPAKPTPGKPLIVLSAASAAIGDSITINGSSWPAGETVLITLTASPIQRNGRISPQSVLARVKVDRNGRFKTTIQLPDVPLLQAQTAVWVVATTANGRSRATAPLTIMPGTSSGSGSELPPPSDGFETEQTPTSPDARPGQP